MSETNDPFARPRRLLKFVFALMSCLFLFYVVIPNAMNMMTASGSGDRELYLKPPEWDANFVTPDQTNFSTLVLWGTYESTASAHTPERSGEFEIVMRGRDLYFRREWKRRLSGWRWRVEMITTNSYSDGLIRWKGMGSGGGGSGSENGKNEIVVGRRMWTETNFVGVLKEFTRETTGSDFKKKTEEFLDLEKYGPFLIPKRIIFKNWDKQVFTYKVEQVQFRNDPDERWFIKRDRFHRSPNEEKKRPAPSSGTTNNLLNGGSINP